MSSSHYHPWVHRWAVLTAAVALLPIGVGAVVTTLDAGMAFPDWPTSDGQNMLTYPWLQSAGGKFVEHGHRLAGIVIGLASISLAAVVWYCEERRWVRWVGVSVLLAVIAQGLLGGLRVRLDERVLALAHGSTAAIVFSLMAVLATVTSRSWVSLTNRDVETVRLSIVKPLAMITPFLVLIQYVLGGLVRHLGTGLYEHLGTAAIVAVFVLATAVTAQQAGQPWLRRAGWGLVAIVALQLSLGAGAWITKFGLPMAGIVAVHHSTSQLILRTAHAVVGVLTLMGSVVLALRVLRVSWLRATGSKAALPAVETSRIPVQGGVG